MTYRVIQWATGNIGRAAVEGIVAHPELELVGAWVHSEGKAGRDVGEVCGLGALGVTASQDVDALLALGADCVHYSPLLGRPDEVIRLLEAGLNVVTPLGWFYPFRTTGAGVAEIEAACRKGGVTLHGSGIHPGGITERFPLMLSALCTNIRHVRAEEFSDIRNYAAEAVVREVMLFGKPLEEAANSVMLNVLGHGFKQSIDMIAAGLHIELDAEKRVTHEMAVATAPIEAPVGTIETGTVAAQRFTWQGTVKGEPVITVRVNWLMGEENLDPPWRLDGQRFEVAFDADPPLELVFHGMHPPEVGQDLDRLPGIIAPAMHCVNAIPYVCEAEPGIKTYLDLPLIAGRFSP
ncbi:MAG: dihydrodipicolinate reductase [Proteobacteria bacterium]|nr:dihydrodipicolinate reductase [Pseudomonadota bacterium]